MVENQAVVLRRYLDRITLETLGGIACLDGGDGMCHGLLRDEPLIAANARWNLQTQDIFAGTPFARRTGYKPKERPLVSGYKTFGLARSGEWLYIEIEYVPRGPASNTYEKAVCVRIAESTLSDIVEKTGISLGGVFHFLVLAVGHWVDTRKALYDDALAVESHLKTEFDLFNAINGR